MNPVSSIWYGVDRFREKYPRNSTYAYCNDNPLIYLDIHGDSLWITYNKQNYLYQDGKIYNKDGSEYNGKLKGFLKDSKEALDIIRGTASGSDALSVLQSSKMSVYINEISNDNHYEEQNRYKAQFVTQLKQTNLDVNAVLKNPKYQNSIGSGGNVFWDPYNTTGGPDEKNNTYRLPYIGLAHELGHAYAAILGIANYDSYNPNATCPLNKIVKDDYNAMYFENRIRYELRHPLRIAYTYDENGSLFFECKYKNN